MEALASTTSTGVAPPAPRRGRREKPWPPGKQKKLLRLYVCTQSEKLPLIRILERLKDESFDPRQRNSHKHLRNLLPDRRIDDWRPRDLATMLIRVRFLRSVRHERRMRNRRVRRRLEISRLQPAGSFPEGTVDIREPPSVTLPMAVSMPVPIMDQPHSARTPVFFSESPVTIKQSDSPGSTPPAVSAGSTVTSSDTYRRDKSPSRASSTTPSTKSAKRRSWASVLSSISSGINSLARSSSSASSKNANLNGAGANAALSKMTREEFLVHLQEKPRKGIKGTSNPAVSLFKPKFSTVNPTIEDLNAALVRMCCSAHVGSNSPGCVHERLSKAIDAQKTEGPDFRNFNVTDEEANMVDKFGNCLLHVAARWGARVSLLLLIMRHTDDIQMINHRGETFLHVYDPPDEPRMRPVSFLNLIRNLRSRGFDFCHRDVEKRTFLHRLVARREFPIETLYYVFREVGQAAARFLVANKTANGERLWHSVRRNLEKTAPKLHRVFGDEVEFIRRYLPEFSDSNVPSTADTSTCGSDSVFSLHPADTAQLVDNPFDNLDPNDSNAQSVRRTPLMKLLRRAAAGRGISDTELASKLEGVLDTASKQPDFVDLHTYLAKRDTEGNTALHYASEFGLVPAVQFLCAKGAAVNVFNNCGNTPLQLVKFAIQRTDVRSDIHMEARYLRCAVLLLEQGAFDQSKLVSERSIIFPYDVFDGSERSISNLVSQGVASECRGLHLLKGSSRHHHYHYHYHHHHYQFSPDHDQPHGGHYQPATGHGIWDGGGGGAHYHHPDRYYPGDADGEAMSLTFQTGMEMLSRED
ncbi:hypothetical protein VTK26DRAFT_6387 [Humicola hyalothermophila]